jgi:hypothetical protein
MSKCRKVRSLIGLFVFMIRRPNVYLDIIDSSQEHHLLSFGESARREPIKIQSARGMLYSIRVEGLMVRRAHPSGKCEGEGGIAQCNGDCARLPFERLSVKASGKENERADKLMQFFHKAC